MTQTISARLIDLASLKTVLLSFVATVIAILVLTGFALPRVIAATGGLEPFDMIWPLTAAEVLNGLAAYDSEAVRAYLVFALLDIPFPILAGLFQVLLWSWLIKLSNTPLLTTFAQRGGLLFAFVPTIFDLSENVGFVLLTLFPPSQMTFLIHTTTFFHAVKMISIDMIFLISGVLILVALLAITRRRARR